MCLGVPGRIVRIGGEHTGMTMGTVSFGGIRKEVCLAFLPEARVGDYVIVHVGFALSRIDEREAQAVFETLRAMGELNDSGLAPENPEKT